MYPWWTEEHRASQEEIQAFVGEVMPMDAETRWRREFPWEIFKKISEEIYTGEGVPKEYGSVGLGATGACIAAPYASVYSRQFHERVLRTSPFLAPIG